jgi:hypothetical protein
VPPGNGAVVPALDPLDFRMLLNLHCLGSHVSAGRVVLAQRASLARKRTKTPTTLSLNNLNWNEV